MTNHLTPAQIAKAMGTNPEDVMRLRKREPEFLTATQAAERLGTSLTNVARWCRDGTLPATRLGIGRIWQIKAEDVDHFTPPARGPKPAEDRKRLLDLAFELISSPDDSYDELTITILARRGQCSRARARQALAKAIRLARGAQVKHE